MDTHSLGLYLRDARNQRDLTLDEAVSALKIRRGILEAFEQGDFSLDASPVQIKGFLRNYAAFLGLDEELVISYYESATAPKRSRRRRRERPPVPTLPTNTPTASARPDSEPSGKSTRELLGDRRELRRRRRSRLLNTLIGTLLVIVSLLIIGIVAVQFLQGEDDLLPQALIGQPTLDTETPTLAPTFTLSAQMASLPEFQQDFDGRGVALTIETQQRTWMRVVVDGAEHMARVVRPGEVLNFRATQEVLMHAANADGLIVFYNGQIQGSYGGRGQEVEVQYLADGINIIKANLPTATFEPSPTPSLTPEQSELQVTDTPLPTITDTPPPTLTPLPNTGSNGEPVTDSSVTETVEVATDPVEQPTATETVLPSETTAPEPTAILPPRETPEDPTPTKTVG